MSNYLKSETLEEVCANLLTDRGKMPRNPPTQMRQLYLSICRHTPQVPDFRGSVANVAVFPVSVPVNPELRHPASGHVAQ